jgi:hypothetical protein
MFIYHLLFFKNVIIYLSLNIFILFIIHFMYGNIFIYFLFSKIIIIKNLYAISFYEILITKIYFSLILTLFNIIPLIFIYFILYFKSGIYKYEFCHYIKLFKIYIKNNIIYLLIGLYIIPLILNNENTSYNIIQIYSYANMCYLIIKIFIMTIIILILPKLYKNINKKVKYIPRSYMIPLMILIIIFGPLTIDILLFSKLILIILIYLEINNILIIWLKNNYIK